MVAELSLEDYDSVSTLAAQVYNISTLVESSQIQDAESNAYDSSSATLSVVMNGDEFSGTFGSKFTK